jgi:2-polyprenyl-3-methyl-5-hydroxy-6-metoxy-1,4-benzoquinol methylase
MDISELNRIKDIQINRHPWELARLNIIKHFLVKHTESLQHILDFGSGDAFILNELQKDHLALYYTAIDSAFSIPILETISVAEKGNISFLNSIPSQFKDKTDCVLILDVLEHCHDDHAVLSSLLNKEILKKDALIVITVPAFHWLFSQHDITLGHFRRYNHSQLKRLCLQNNLKIIESGYFFFTLLLIRILQFLKEKIIGRKVKKTIDNWGGSKWLTKIISAILSIDFLITRIISKFGIRIPGLSVYCLCRF